MTDPLLTVVLDRWRQIAGQPTATADEPFTGPHAPAYAADLSALLGLAVSADDVAGTPRSLADLLRDRRRSDAPAAVDRAVERTDGTTSEATPGQAGIWYACEFGDPAAYNSPIRLGFSRAPEPEPLRRALAHVVARHESLRTTFALAEDGRLTQRIAAEPRFDFETTTATGPGELRPATSDFATAPLDLRTGPLLRVRYVAEPGGRATVLVNAHHAVFDGFSWSVLLTEWLSAYQHLAAGRVPPARPAPPQFRSVTAARNAELGPAAEQSALDYWKQHLADAPPLLDLPLDRPRGRRALTAERVRTVLPEPTTRVLRARAAAEGVTPLTVLLTAYAVLLHRHTGQRDLTVGIPVSLRDRPGDEEAIGHLVNTVVLRHRLAPQETVREQLARCRTELLGALRHKEAAFEDVVRALGAGREDAGSPLFRTMVTLMPKDRRVLRGLGLEGDAWHHVSGAPKYDLALIVAEGEEELDLTFEYDPALFNHRTVERIAARFHTLLTDLVEQPECTIGELRWVPEAEARELPEVWHGPADPRPATTSVTALFEQHAAARPDATAVETVAGDRLTYRRLNAAANRLARELRDRGIGAGKRVAVSLDRGPDAIVALLAILKAGAAFVPLDPAYPAARQRLMLEDARPALLLTRGEPRTPLPETTEVFDLAVEEGRVRRQDPADLPLRRGPEDETYVVYTSGTTGRPKGVVIRDFTLTNVAYRQMDLSGPRADSRMLQYMSLSFDVSFEEMFGSLCAGGTLVLTDEEMRADLHRLAHYLRERRVARVFLPYVALQELASVVVEGDIAFPDLAEVYTTGEQLIVTPALREMFGRLTAAALINAYGPSETHLCTALRLPEDPASWPERPSIGRTVGEVRMYVLDEDRRPVPFGVPGELYVGGRVVSPGYLDLPDQTRARFVPDPYAPRPGARMYRTGDLVSCTPEEGFVHLGRIDEQIKIRGHRVEPAEVEAVLNELPSVSASAVVAAEHGPGDRRLVAFLRTPEPVDEAALRRRLSTVLPAHLVPSRLARVDQLPTSPTGKTDRAALAMRAAELPPPRREETAGRPLTANEQRVAAVWAELLDGVEVGPEDDFFAQGGHSLLTVRLRRRIEAECGVELPLSVLLADPTVAGMAARVERARAGLLDNEEPDLWADVRLPESLAAPAVAATADAASARTVLLTGVTGFLGVFLLRSLLDAGCTVHCLVRADSAADGLRRIEENARRYRVDDGLDLSRVRVVPGDLTRERFGLDADVYRELAGRVETVYHSAAHINFAAPYASVRAANVDGFVRVAEFCVDTVLKPLHHMSTLAVFSPEGPARDVDEDAVPDVAEGLGIGYAQSKWVAERLALQLRERGVPVTVHRIGRIGPDATTGACRPDDFFWLQVKSFIQLALVPAELGPPVDLLPADVVADAVVRLSRSPATRNQNTHVFHPVGMNWGEVLDALSRLGAAPRPVPVSKWLTALESHPAEDGDSSLASLVPLFREGVMELADHRYHNERTVRLLKELGMELPAPAASWVTSMVGYFVENGQLSLPDAP
ncbi:amino acid adenylation domain-containing protein [Streptomyces sp. BRB081]|uniref:non-ribosomal peptide synthetase n=1 Tax=Streptomyces sp. BRB081 TaxID=2769544 RepID=UPI0018ACD10C|nr:non-ribosomal peptide synthetase [Streptomyces sp. BRB081]MBL3808355.1 amino acid adenylation domain-containing protein [Streptomyces sp. BRB081]